MAFDRKAAWSHLQRGANSGRTSTQSWDVDAWTAAWRDPDGKLAPGSLGVDGGTWWFRALTDPRRLVGSATDPDPSATLTPQEAIQLLGSFGHAADKILRHWPRHALAPVAFALREALGPAPTLEILSQTVPPGYHADFVRWLGPLDRDTANALMTAVTYPDAVLALVDLGGEAEHALERLTTLDALAEADAIADLVDVQTRATWRLENEQPVDVLLLEEAAPVVDDDTYVALVTRLLRMPNPRVWSVVADRPLPDGVSVPLPETLNPTFEPAPPLPFEEWTPWMTAVSDRGHSARLDPWIDARFLPEVRTRSGHRLDDTIVRGMIAELSERPYFDDFAPDIDSESTSGLWQALFEMWWASGKPPHGRWILRAAAPLCDDAKIREIVARLGRHRHWYGDFSGDVIAALGRSRRDWAVVLLEQIALTPTDPDRRSAATSLHRRLAHDMLQRAADAHGVLVDRYVEIHFPHDVDPQLEAIAANRLEEALSEGRVWTTWTWRELLRIPAFATAAKNLLWSLVDGYDDACIARWDGEELLDAGDEPVELDEEALIKLAHPATLDDEAYGAWSVCFADHEVVQPFEQLERARFRRGRLSADGFRSPGAREFDGAKLVRKATARMWVTYTWGAHGRIAGLRRSFPNVDVRAEIAFTEPLDDGTGQTRLQPMRFMTLHGDPLADEDTDAVAFSEAYRDLMHLIG